MALYRHTQPGTLLAAVLGLALVVICLSIPHPAARLIGCSILLLVLLLFHSLTATVTRRAVRACFGFGPISRTVAIADITAAARVRNKWWYGWGIRLVPNGWMFNISGLDAVELQLNNGRIFRIGSDEPDRLLAAIKQALQDRA